MLEVALLLSNTDDFNKLKIISEVALLLPNIDRLQQVEEYIRGCTISSEYWPTSTGWRLCQRLHYFYQILTAFNMLRIMSEVVLLLPNTDQPQQVEDYVRGCTTSSEYWQPSTGWRLSQRLHYFYQILTISTSWRLSQRLHYCYRIQTDLNRLKINSEVALLLANTDRPQQVEYYVRSCTTSTKYWPTSTGWRLCQRLHYF
jgi:hypothetical protein